MESHLASCHSLCVFFQAEDGIRDDLVTGVQTCALPILIRAVVEMSDYRRARPGRGLGFSFIDYAGTMVAAVAEVSIDKTRGKVTVHDFWLALDPGIAVQPDNVVAQTESPIVSGLRLALPQRLPIKAAAGQQSNDLH